MTTGYLNLVLHAHLPFVRHLDRDDRLEERWLFEAITETYIPLLQMFQRLVRDDVDFRVTLSLSPPLISMLADGLLQVRYRSYLRKLISLAEKEVVRTQDEPQFHTLAGEYLQRFLDIQQFFESYDGNILPAFGELRDAGKVELITSAATHAFLPYIQTDASLRAQIATAIDVFEHHFCFRPNGMWLPECAYTPRIEHHLQAYGIRYFFVDAHGLAAAQPRPVFGVASPILTHGGTAVFARDEASSQQVWSSESGYPGDFDYREYYRDIGYDLADDYIRPYIHPDGIRVNTGIKYYRITGTGGEKAPYDFARAREKAAVHAGNFLFNRQKQVEYLKRVMGRTPVITAPYDAELFGHWWYEGPIFIEMLLRKLHFDQTELKTIAPSEYLALYPDFQSCQLQMSTWGRGGYGDVWLNGQNDWIYPALHDCEQQMIHLANAHPTPNGLVEQALNQAARELMLAQSSDWAFIMDTGTMVDYAVKRTKLHIHRFRALANMIREEHIDTAYLANLHANDNIYPAISYQIYQTNIARDQISHTSSRLRVLMLSWEFPPLTVGGLARHTYDLSRHLVQQGIEVHVVTMAIGDYPLYETIEGVHVHRVRVLQPDGGEFTHFILQLNLMMLDACHAMVEQDGVTFDLIHAHDWLVCDVAKTLKQQFEIPLIATIHATEYGRNHGIYTDMQRHIHHLEWELTYEAARVIVCSTYMKQELETVFRLPSDKIDVLPNGVDRAILQAPATAQTPRQDVVAIDNWTPMVLFVGRLVREKGVHLLLAAIPSILAEFPQVKFVIAGKGPMQDDLVTQAQQLGIATHVDFAGFVSDEVRNGLLREADVAVFPSLYEPFGIVALEAMAARTPVVVADVGGLGDIVRHAHNGLKAFPNDVSSLAEQIKWLLREREFANRLADVAEQALSRFDWQHIASSTIGVYQLLFPGQIAVEMVR
ncbi:1,4-alpha-glucan branching protein domain-containing protein [Alicyclobacillus fodiniaquatilis]|uniref:1,4-alpha-glucan branching protein domain-containing protein n=1 Tax=Alicyclobacillus fodiniaquatilis TaxID=1661150 RepID=A0ABW4JQ69_9BACL